MGWKTITGTIVVAVGRAFQTLGNETLDGIGKVLEVVGIAFFGVGIRSAIKGVKDKVG